MKFFAALVVTLSISGCVIHFPTHRDAHDEDRRVPTMFVICIFASCHDIEPTKEKQKTLTPAPSARKSESATSPQASRLDPGSRGQGISPNKP